MRCHPRLALATLVAALLIAPASTVTRTAPMAIKLATMAPIGTSYHHILQEMGERWKNAPGGGVTLRVFAGGTQGSEVETVTRMRLGQLQAATLSVGGLTEIDQSVAALQFIPMLYASLAEQEYVREKMRPELERRLLAKGFVAVFWLDSGWVHYFSRTVALRPADLKPMKVFVTGSESEQTVPIMQSVGYRPVTYEWADALTQMETGNIDAVPVVPILALSGQYYRVMRHVTQVNWATLVGATVVTRQAWDALPSEARAELMAAGTAAGLKMQAAGRLENEQAMQTMRSRLNVEVHELTPPLVQEWRTFAESVYPRIRGTIVPADAFDQARQLVNEYRATHGGPSR